MIITVTPNTALDKVILVDDFELGATVRAKGTVYGMGGKGAVVSWVLGQLGTPSLALGFAAGDTGRRIDEMLRKAAVQTDFIWVQGETRTNLVLARISDGVQGTVTIDGLHPQAADIEALTDKTLAALSQGEMLFCGGSLPAGMAVDAYVPLIRAAKQRGVITFLDTSDAFLAPNLAAKPDIIKPNAAEASALLGRRIESISDAAQAVMALCNQGIAVPTITLGELGAVAATPEGLFHLPPLRVHVQNTAGAGDGFGAGLMQARLQGKDWATALRWAVAVASAVLLTPETGACHLADAKRLFVQTQAIRL